jgi:hypothetical protein
MRLMCWDVNIVHQNDHYIADANYWSQLSKDLCFDPLFKAYLDLTRSLCLENPPSSALPMQLENMPYYRGPRIATPPADTDDTTNAAHCQAIYSSVMINNCFGLCHLSHVPVKFGNFKQALPPRARALHNNGFPCYTQQVLQFSWAVYSFHGGHFASTIQSQNLHFHV